MMTATPSEVHPLKPFLPSGSRLLLLGSFPPPRKRWKMDFFYPNPTNDMWRVMGLVFYSDKDHFFFKGSGGFRQEEIEAFLRDRGIALFDTAEEIRRLRSSASDAFLEIVRPTDIGHLLDRIPQCHHIAATGGKAFDLLCRYFHKDGDVPSGGRTEASYKERRIALYRMPSTSRAYPLRLELKASAYEGLMRQAGIL